MRDIIFDIIGRDRASGAFRSADKSAGMLHGTLSKMGGFLKTGLVAAATGGAIAIAGIGAYALKTGIETASSMQQANIGFETLLGSAEKAKKYVADLSEFAAKTPFEFAGLVDASRLLLGVGVASEKVIPMLTDFGDAAGALSIDQVHFQNIMLATSQAISAGRFQVGDLNQLMTNGLPAWTLLSKAMHKSVPELRDLASKGKLLASDVLPALQAEMHKDYGGAMIKQSQTLSGLWSTLQDTFSQGMAQVLQPLIPILQNAMPGAINVLSGVLTRFGGWLADTGVPAVEAFFTAFKYKDNMAYATDGLLGIQDAGAKARVVFDAVATAGRWVGSAIAWLGGAAKATWGVLQQGYQAALPALKFVMDNVRDGINSLTSTGINWKQLLAATIPVLKVTAAIIGGVIVVALVALSMQFRIAAEGFKQLVPAFRFVAGFILTQMGIIVDGAAWAFGWIPGIGPKLKWAQSQFHQFADGVNNALSGIQDKQVHVEISAIGNGVTLYKSSNGQVAYKGPTGNRVRAMAKGGIVPARPGGTLVRVGEAGQDEVVIPLGTPGSAVGGAGGGFTLVVNVTQPLASAADIARAVVPALLSTPMSLRGLAQKLAV